MDAWRWRVWIVFKENGGNFLFFLLEWTDLGAVYNEHTCYVFLRLLFSFNTHQNIFHDVLCSPPPSSQSQVNLQMIY